MTAPRVAIVKSAGRADAFAQAVRSLGCVPVLVSPFRVEPVEVEAGRLDEIERRLRAGGWIAVTSPHAVPALQSWVARVAGARIAAVGPGTASALHAAGLQPEIVGDAGGAALARRMRDAGVAPGAVVVHPCGEDSRRELGESLSALGAEVIAVPVYRMVRDPVGERAVSGTFAGVVVGSPRLAARAATLFAEPRPPVVAIGRTTAAALRDLGWSPAAVAAQPTPEDVAAALGAAGIGA